MSSHLPTDEALDKEDRIDEMEKNSPPVPLLLQAQQAPALPYVKVVGRPGTGSYPVSELSPFLELCPFEKIRMKYSQQDISKSIWARGLKLG